MISTVIFDMDGTLVDTERVSQAAWKEAFAQLGVDDVEEDFIRSFIGQNAASIIDRFIEVLGSRERADRAFKLHYEIFVSKSRTELVAKPGARETVLLMRERGYRVGLASSTYRDQCLARLARFGMNELFDSITCGNEVSNGKPAPDIFLKAARRLGSAPGECVVVEDSLNGVRAGHAAGMRVLMVPDLVAPTDEVAALCDAVLGSLYEVDAAVAALS